MNPQNPILIGIAGRKHHGKSAVASILSRNFAFLPLAFADPLKQILMHTCGFSYTQLYGGTKEVFDERVGKSPREAMQELGSFGRGTHPDTWVRMALTTIMTARQGVPVSIHSETSHKFLDVCPSIDRWVISDCRHQNEADAIRQAGGIVILVQRPAADSGLCETHESEVGIGNLVVDHVLVNDGTLYDLQQKVLALMSHIGISAIPTKHCLACGQFKPVSDFENDRCRPCQQR